MTIWWLYLILGLIGATGIAFVWLIVTVSGQAKPVKKSGSPIESLEDAVDQDVEHIFNEEFREELRNRGRLHFEKIIGENAMFLQQDLRLTTSQLNEYMKTEIASKLKDEFRKYEESIEDAKQMAIASIQKTNAAIDEQRALLGEAVQKEIVAEKQQIVQRFEKNMTDIINHYVIAAIGNQIDLNDQLEFILADLQTNKQAIIEDITNGA